LNQFGLSLSLVWEILNGLVWGLAKSGLNQTKPNFPNTTCYITAISTPKLPNIPAELYAFSAADNAFFPDHTIVFAIGKAFYPPPRGSEACHH
jgi:hypothetical protein